MGSYKWGHKFPNMGFSYSYPTYVIPLITTVPMNLQVLQLTESNPKAPQWLPVWVIQLASAPRGGGVEGLGVFRFGVSLLQLCIV